VTKVPLYGAVRHAIPSLVRLTRGVAAGASAWRTAAEPAPRGHRY
jgi:hypothetical protein